MTATQLQTTAPTATRKRVLNISLWVVQVLLAAFYVSGALSKLAGQQVMVEMYDQIGFGQWLRYLTGILELAGAVGLLVPRLCGLAAAGLAAVMVGATTASVLFLGGPSTAVLPAGLFVVFVLLAWARRDRTKAVVDSLRR